MSSITARGTADLEIAPLRSVAPGEPTRAGAAGPSDRPAASADTLLTRGAEVVVAVLLCALAGFAVVAVPLAVTGSFRPLFVGPPSLVVTAALIGAWRPWLRIGTPVRGAGWSWVAVMGLAALGVTVSWGSVNQHVQQDRDPGHYLNGAVWLAEEGTLLVDAAPGPFAHEPAVTPAVIGTRVGDDGRATFQSLHLVSAYGAALGWLGGRDVLLRTGLVLGAIALLAFHALALRLTRPVWATVATMALGLDLAFVFFTRDLYSEVPLLACVLGGAWALDVALAGRSPRRALVAGLLFGLGLMLRIDAPLALIGLVPLAAVLVARARPPHGSPLDGRPPTGRVLLALVPGVATGAVLGTADGLLRSRSYLAAHGSDLAVMGSVVAAAVAVALALGGLLGGGQCSRRELLRRRVRPHRRWVAVAAAVVVVVVAVGLLLIRPNLQVDHAVPRDVRLTRSLQVREGEAVDGHRSYAEDSARWMLWYLGAPAAAAAVAGAALLVGRALRSRARRVELLVLGLVGPSLVLYLVRPSIYPDHPWVMRRFVPVVLPGLVLMAAFALSWLWDQRTTTAGRWRLAGAPAAALAVVGGVAMVLHPVAVLGPVPRFHSYAGQLDAIEALCTEMGDDVAVVVVPSRTLVDLTLPQAVRGVCDVPAVAGRRDPDGPRLDPENVSLLARRWRAEGRELWLIADRPARITDLGAGVAFDRRVVSDQELQPTLNQRPSEYRTSELRVVAGPVG